MQDAILPSCSDTWDVSFVVILTLLIRHPHILNCFALPTTCQFIPNGCVSILRELGLICNRAHALMHV